MTIYLQFQLVFQFTQGITEPLKAALEEVKVTVQGQIMEVSQDTLDKLDAAADTETSSMSDRLTGGSAAEEEQEAGEGIMTATEWLKRQALCPRNSDDDKQIDCDTPQLPCQLPQDPSDVDKLDSSQHSSSDESEEDVGISGGRCAHQCSSSGEASLVPSDTARGSIFCAQPPIQRVNLDITSLICIASNLCYGRADFVFEEKILTQQAERERANPLLPHLQAFMEGKN